MFCVWGGDAVSRRQHPCVALREANPRRLVNNLTDFVLAAIKWAHGDSTLWFSVPPQRVPPARPFYLQQPGIISVSHPALGLYINHILNTMPAEPGALIKHMRTQICTFCQSVGGFPTEMRNQVSQFSWKHHRCKWRMTKIWILILFFLGGEGVVLGYWFYFELFLCPLRHIIIVFLCIGCCCYHRWCVRQEQNFHCVWGRGRPRPDFYLLIHNVFFYGVDLEHRVAASWPFSEKERQKKKTQYRTFFFLTLLLWSARPSLKCVERQTEHGGKLWC